ncbi:AGE family epimerase/isomerase [Parapedobacter lycopersici]|uniref:AGE family epimerase/isomerase n=1 Tax=Parapedobacter lycopersici TaxID=1864939 RepID=UPI00214D23E2|nr:AGE family epimerase/isomerase [Parapedobacter lycopersici]
MNNIEYSRRSFIKQQSLLGLGMLAFGLPGGFVKAAGATPATDPVIGTLGAMTLKQLRDRYHTALFDQFIPNMDALVIDHEYGGFMCNVDIITRERKSDAKSAWYEGRGLWTYSFLYNNFGQDPAILKAATGSKDFIIKHIIRDTPADGEFWPASYNRTGTEASGEGNIYGHLFIAEGLAEFARASGDEAYYQQAKEIVLDCLRRYDQADYAYHVNYLSADAPRVPGPRVLGHWMVFLRAATQILEQRQDPEIEQLASRCVDAIMNHHLNPEYGLMNELLNHDFSRPDNAFANFSYLGHAIETLWMVMFEAGRKKDQALFRTASAAFCRHVKVAADRIYGGFFRSLDHVDQYTWKVDKVLWLQEEVLIGTLFLLEHTGDTWAQQCFDDTYQYVQDKFAKPEYAFWISAGNRKLTEFQQVRAEHYHHPRHLMLNLLALNRMVERGGKISGIFD